MTPSSYTEQMISILTPTRLRPENVKRLVSSARLSAISPELLEFVFYVDNDDTSFPREIIDSGILVVDGPKIHMSLMQNVMYTKCHGEIIMYSGDDLVFKTFGWDEVVRLKFNGVKDGVLLVHANDLAHGAKIATHGFLHRNWINAVGSWVAAGRGSLFDLWLTEVARKIGRICYLEDVEIIHLHYRQGSGLAEFDQTYKNVSMANASWVPVKTYNKLKRERRIDRILLTEIMNPKPKIEKSYMVGEFLAANKNRLGMHSVDSRRLRTLNNWEVFPLLARNIMKVLIGKRRR